MSERYTMPTKTKKPDMPLTKAMQEELAARKQVKEQNPIPVPVSNELEKEFMSRCISFLKHEDSERPDEQIQAICVKQWQTRESFQWSEPIIDRYKNGQGNFIQGIALSVGESRNFTDYQRRELMASARTLIGQPLLVNHNKNLRVGYVADCEFEDDTVEYIAKVTNESYWRKIQKGLIQHVSPLGTPRFWLRTEQQKLEHTKGKRSGTPIGIRFEELSLVEAPQQAGDLSTSVQIMETLLPSQQPQLLEAVTIRKPNVGQLAELESAILALVDLNETDEDKAHTGEYWDGEKWVGAPKDLPAFELALLKTRVIKQVFTEIKKSQSITHVDGVDGADSVQSRLKVAELESRIDNLQNPTTHSHAHINPKSLHIRDFMRIKKKPKRGWKSEDKASETEETGQQGIILSPKKASKETTINPKKLHLRDLIDHDKHRPIYRR